MYQYYYSTEKNEPIKLNKSVSDIFNVTKVRATMWEEHCLECSAPLCYSTCLNYVKRQDGRCKLFDDSIAQYENQKALVGKCARIKFRKWGNMMSIVYPQMLTIDEYKSLDKQVDKVSRNLKKTVDSALPITFKWNYIRTREFLRRKNLKNGTNEKSDAFVLHCYNHKKQSFNLFIEIFDNEHNSCYKTSFLINEGENLYCLPASKYNSSCDEPGKLIKIYPENNYDADITFLWCDFVQGTPVEKSVPADKVKCVVWDLDNTLWNGILIESDEGEKLKLRSGVLDLIKSLDERGILNSISSKNDFEPAKAMLIKLGIFEYFIYPQINWDPKSESIRQIASDINIGLDTLAFIDDSSFERNQVQSELPQVRVFDEKSVSTLLNEECFDVVVTEESKKRRLSYKAEEKRNKIKVSSNYSIEEFIKHCEIKLNLFTPKTDEELLRCYELVLRTNQLNISGIKYTREQFDSRVADESRKTLSFSCSDLFGDYGIVGFLQYSVVNDTVNFLEFAMSCRVAGKFIESALFKKILEVENCSKGVFDVNITKKNILLRNTLEKIGFECVDKNDDRIKYEFKNNLINDDLVEVNLE